MQFGPKAPFIHATRLSNCRPTHVANLAHREFHSNRFKQFSMMIIKSAIVDLFIEKHKKENNNNNKNK